MYLNRMSFRGVQATGTMGWDEFRFNLKAADHEAIQAGQTLE